MPVALPRLGAAGVGVWGLGLAGCTLSLALWQVARERSEKGGSAKAFVKLPSAESLRDGRGRTRTDAQGQERPIATANLL